MAPCSCSTPLSVGSPVPSSYPTFHRRLRPPFNDRRDVPFARRQPELRKEERVSLQDDLQARCSFLSHCDGSESCNIFPVILLMPKELFLILFAEASSNGMFLRAPDLSVCNSPLVLSCCRHGAAAAAAHSSADPLVLRTPPPPVNLWPPAAPAALLASCVRPSVRSPLPRYGK